MKMIGVFIGKTELEFWQIAENWYARAHRLREIWQNDQNTERRMKAIILWVEMVKRVDLCVSIAKKISIPSPKFEKGQ